MLSMMKCTGINDLIHVQTLWLLPKNLQKLDGLPNAFSKM